MEQNVVFLNREEWEYFMQKLNRVDLAHQAVIEENERFLREEVTVEQNNGVTTIEIPWLSDEDLNI